MFQESKHCCKSEEKFQNCILLDQSDIKSENRSGGCWVLVTVKSRWRRRRPQNWTLSPSRRQTSTISVVNWQWRGWSSRRSSYRLWCCSEWAATWWTWRCWRAGPWSRRPTATWRHLRSTTSCTWSSRWRWRCSTTRVSVARRGTSTIGRRSAGLSPTPPVTPASGSRSRSPSNATSPSVIRWRARCVRVYPPCVCVSYISYKISSPESHKYTWDFPTFSLPPCRDHTHWNPVNSRPTEVA